MANAKDLGDDSCERILLVGDIGSGKTTQFLTLPGRKFLYVFDPNALSSIKGYDIEYETFFPTIGETDFYPTSIKKGGQQFSDTKKKFEPMSYLRWTEDVNERFESGFFNDFDVVGLDGLTMFSAAAMDRISFLQNRIKSEDDRTDYRIAGDKVANAVRALTELDVTFFCTAHTELYQDDKSKRVFKRIMLPGGARARVPTVFTNIWIPKGERTEDGYEYTLQTKPDRENPIARTSLTGLEFEEDITIPDEILKKKDLKQLENYGIGRLLNRAKQQVQQQKKE